MKRFLCLLGLIIAGAGTFFGIAEKQAMAQYFLSEKYDYNLLYHPDRLYHPDYFEFFHLCNPVLNSVSTAHGNTDDWHIDTAEEFLYGTEMDGDPSAANHCPNAWTKSHMHIGDLNTNHFYYDDALIGSGDDDDSADGIDHSMLFFYAGHGCPEYFNTLGNNAVMGNMLLGNCNNGGLLRYYWQCSCKVFAHGPEACFGSTSTFDYACPGDFDGSSDSESMRNVYERWGPVLGDKLRMACGSSTAAYCHEDQMNRIWDNYNNQGKDVADSFIFGLHGTTGYDSNVVPLCITRGGWSVVNTPLWLDSSFTNQPHPYHDKTANYYHIQYLENFDSNTPQWRIFIPKILYELPKIRFIPFPDPPPFENMKFYREGNLKYSYEVIDGRGPKVRINENSGAVYIRGDRQIEQKGLSLSENTYIEMAKSYLEENGLYEEDMTQPFGTKMVIQRVSIDDDDVSKYNKNVQVVFRRQIRMGKNMINVLGEGGQISVQMNNDGSVINASKVWRQIDPEQSDLMYRVKTFDQALAEAKKEMGDEAPYELAHWNWGYKETSGNVEQLEMSVVFQFWFEPTSKEFEQDYPPRMIEIEGQY